MNDTERPWAAKGMTHRDRAIELCAKPDGPPRIMEIKEAIEAAVRDALADAAPKWTPVTERLPGSERCLAIGKHWGCPAIAQYIDGEWWSYGYRSRTVTHWMPLPPAPPEPGEEVK